MIGEILIIVKFFSITSIYFHFVSFWWWIYTEIKFVDNDGYKNYIVLHIIFYFFFVFYYMIGIYEVLNTADSVTKNKLTLD
jgi:hypothetical protein